MNTYGKYLAHSVGKFAILGLPDAGTASLQFTEGGIALAAVNPAVNAFTYINTDIVAMPASANGNPANATLTIHQTAGAMRGNFTLIETSPPLTRKVKYQGIIVRPVSGAARAKGYFLLPQIPLPGQKQDTSPLLSGGVQITQ